MFLSGAGLFSLITEAGLGEEIFTQVTKRFDDIRQRLAPLTPSSSLDEESSDDDGETPDLPPRNYRQDTLKRVKPRAVRQYETIDLSDEEAPKVAQTPLLKKVTSQKSRPPKQESNYEEIVLEDEPPKPKPPKSKSPSFLNNLIHRHRTRGRVNHSTSTSSSSSEENISEETFYHVLSNNNSSKKASLEQNYTQVGKRSFK